MKLQRPLFHTHIISLPRCLMMVFLLIQAPALQAHNGIDHGNDVGAAEIHRLSEPRFAQRTDRTEIVGIVSAAGLELFIDAAGTNQPLELDQVLVETDTDSFTATRVDKGHYRLPGGWITPGQKHNLLLTVIGPGHQDLVAASLEPGRSPATPSADRPPGLVAIWISLGLVGAFTLWVVGQGLPVQNSSRITFGAVMAAIIGTGLVLTFAMGPQRTSAEADDSARPPGQDNSGLVQTVRRLQDGSLYVPKPSQHKLGIRTTRPDPASAPRSARLIGKVQASPDGSADILAALDGSLNPPEGGFPHPGQTVEKDELLAVLKPVLAPSERADKEAELAYLERDIYLMRKQIQRLEAQDVVRQDNSIQLDIRRAELKGFLKRKRALERMFESRIEIRSPIAGVVSDVTITAGENVRQGEPLFRVIDPDALWVEVISYSDEVAAAPGPASIRTPQQRIPLEFVGRGSQQRALGQPLFFAVGEPAALSAGELVEVDIAYGSEIPGLTVDRDAIAVDAEGNRVVWAHAEPERFTPQPVEDVQPAAPGKAFITGDLDPGIPLVSNGAALLNAAP